MSHNYRKIYKPLTRRFLFALVLISSFSLIGFAQTEETEESPVVIPEQAIEQVVRRILTWHFKPRNKPTTIYLSEQQGLKKSWLPEIKNIEFQLLSDEDARQNDGGVYFFTEPELSGDKYTIGFGFGDIDCDATGENWHFRISKQRVRLWHGNTGFGRACGSGNSF